MKGDKFGLAIIMSFQLISIISFVFATYSAIRGMYLTSILLLFLGGFMILISVIICISYDITRIKVSLQKSINKKR